jgi:hypothetical protein
VAQDKKEEAKDSAESTWDATKQKAGEVAGNAQENKDGTKDSAGSTWESAKESAGQTWDDTKQKAGEARDEAAATVDSTRDRSYDAAGATKEHSASAWEQMKQKASNFLGSTQYKTNETADAAERKANETGDSSASTWDATKKSVSDTTQDAENKLNSTWQSTKDKTSEVFDDAKHQADSEAAHKQRRGPLIDLQGLKERASHFLGGHHEEPKPSEEAGEKQKASQFLEAGKNETADTFGETQDRNALSESTAGVTHPGATHAGSVWDSTKDKSAHSTKNTSSHSGPELNWSDIKQKASQFLESTNNEVADTVNEAADRKTLSESTLGATQPGSHGASHPMDPTYAKTKGDNYHTPAVAQGVDWKEKASQMLQSFGNETADTFDTIQDTNITSEKAQDPVAANVQDALDKGKTLQQEARDDVAEVAARRDDHTAASGGLTWDSLKQKATSVLGSIQHASQNAADSAHEQAKKGAHDQNYSATEAAMRKAADIAGVASDRAGGGVFPGEEPVFTSETRRATADQVADYAAK